MKALVVGYGSAGKRHRRVLRELGVDSDIVTKQVVDDAIVYHSLDEISCLAAYDYFVIATDTYRHEDELRMLVSSIQSKVIVIEKPAFHRHAVIPANSNRIHIAYNLRFHPVISNIRKLLKECQPIMVHVLTGQNLTMWRPERDYRQCYSANRALGGGVLRDLSHEIDYLFWLFGLITPFAALQEKISSLEVKAEDLAMFIGRCSGGAVVNCSVDYLSWEPIRRITVHTDDETIIGDLIAGTVQLSGRRQEHWTFQPNEMKMSTSLMHKDIIGNHGNACTLEEGLQVIDFIESVEALATPTREETW